MQLVSYFQEVKRAGDCFLGQSQGAGGKATSQILFCPTFWANHSSENMVHLVMLIRIKFHGLDQYDKQVLDVNHDDFLSHEVYPSHGNQKSLHPGLNRSAAVW